MRLENMVACITGAARGIGREIALAFARQGAVIALCDMDESLLEETLKEIKKLSPESEKFVLNVTNFADSQATANKILDKFKKIDILVNNAGITRDNLLLRMSESEWDQVIAVNLKGAFNCVKAFSRQFLKQRQGKIINIASIIGIMGNVGQANYAASKAGVIGFTKSIAREFGSRNINVNAVAPGFIQTEMTARLPQDIQEKMKAQIPLGRFGTPADVANLCLFLGSDDSNYITGQAFIIDGGMIM